MTGDVVVVRGEGLPHFNDERQRGDLHVQLHVEFPSTLDAKQKEGTNHNKRLFMVLLEVLLL